MVSKCANPGCATSFRYFHQGKLYRIEIDAGADRRRVTFGAESKESGVLRRLEFYWLCDRCSELFTLVYDRKNGVALHPREQARAAAS
jgi:hypothetical protein